MFKPNMTQALLCCGAIINQVYSSHILGLHCFESRKDLLIIGWDGAPQLLRE